MILFFSLYALGNVVACLGAVLLRPRLSRWRWACARRNLVACWTTLPLAQQQRFVAAAWCLAEAPRLAEAELMQLLLQALDERWCDAERSGIVEGDLLDRVFAAS